MNIVDEVGRRISNVQGNKLEILTMITVIAVMLIHFLINLESANRLTLTVTIIECYVYTILILNSTEIKELLEIRKVKQNTEWRNNLIQQN